MIVRSLPELFALPHSPLDGAAPSSEDPGNLPPAFDLSNPAIQAKLDAAGTILSARPGTGSPASAGPWKLDVIPVNTGPVLAISKVRAALLQEQVLLTSYSCGGLACQIISFVPSYAPQDPPLPALIQILHLTNPSPVPQSVLLRFPSEFSSWEASGLRIDFPGSAGLLQLDNPHPEIGSLDFDLEAGDERFLSFAWILAPSPNEVRASQKLIQQRSAPAWLEETLTLHAAGQ